MNQRRTIALIIAAIILLGGVGWYALSRNQSSDTATINPTVTPTSTSSATPVSSITSTQNPTISPTPQPSTPATSQTKALTVTASNYSFSPASLTVNQGDTVKLTLKNSGGTHDWVLDEFNARTNLLSDGQEQTIQFVASKTGTFEYYCSYANHRAMGMVGKLIVQ